MATGGLYGNSGTGALIAQPGAETPGLYGKSPNGSVVAQPGSESAGLYGNGTTFGGYYFEWFVFQTSATQPATPTGGSWNFQTDSGTAPSGWTNAPASNPTNPVWISIALVNSRSTSPLVWSTPGVLSYSGTINGSGAPTSGIGQIGELYIQTGVTPNALWFKSGSTTWTQITGSALYVDLTSSQTIAGTKTFSSTIQGNISGNAGTVTNGVYTNGTYVDPSWIASLAGSKITGNISGNAANVTGTVAIVNGGTGATTASGARTNLGLGTIATQDASSVAITGGSITGITDLAIADGGTGASTAGQARTNLGLGTAAVLDNTDAVTSVNGFTGTVVLTAANVNALAIANNLSDLADASTARTNLGLGTAATQNSTAFATAAQGATADTALQTVTSADGSIVVLQSGTNIDLAVSAASPASTLLAQVRNTTGATLTKGTAVYISGATGQISTVSKALANSDATSAQTLGLITADIANNSNGYVTVIGLITNTNTSAYTDGQQLYLSPTTAGTLTATKPYAPQHLVYVAIVEHAHPTQGKLFVKVQNGYEMDELHNVSAQSPTTGQTLVYNASTSLWEKSFAPIINGTTINNTTIGATTPSTGVFTTLTSNSTSEFGKGSAQYIRAVGDATAPVLSAQGSGTNIDFNVTTKGYGSFKINDAGGTIAEFNDGGSGTPVNSFLFAAGGASGTRALIRAMGGPITLLSTGSNSVNFATNGASGNIQALVSHTASAVNYVQVTGAATGGAPAITSQGSDANIGLSFSTKGAFNTSFRSGNGSWVQFVVNGANNSVNYLSAAGSVSNQAPVLSSVGSDTNISQVFQSKGTGAIDLAAGSSGVNISNGGTVTAITRTASGSGYTSFPTWTASAPTTAGGATASGTPTNMTASGFTVASGGTGYTVGNVLTVTGGSTGNCTLTVTAVSSGAVTAATLATTVSYTALPTNPVSVTGGTGSGATFNLTYGIGNSLTITNAGSGYVEQPTVTFSGGGGSGAAAYATVGATATIKGLYGGNSQIPIQFAGPAGNILQLMESGTTSSPTALVIKTGGSSAQMYPSLTNSSLSFSASGTSPIDFYTGVLSALQARVAHTASAVNYVQVTGAATGSGPTISSQGSDANARLLLNSKGSSSGIDLLMNNSRQVFIGTNGSAVNYWLMGGSTAGFGPVLSAQGSDTNIPAVVQPKGTGALQAQQTDSTATGGNARGANAVDWQTARDAASRVASGQYSVVTGGYANTASGTASLSGGFLNNNSGNFSFLGGGAGQNLAGSYAVIAGGWANTASGFINFIGGGYGNSGTSGSAVTTQSGTMNATTAVTLSSSNANIKVGQYISGTSISNGTYVAAISGTSLTLSQVASGSSTSTLSFFTPHGVVVGGGNNQATGSYSFIGGGGDAGTAANRNVASGDWSKVGGGRNNTASGAGSVVGGGGYYSGIGSSNVGNTSAGDGSFVGGGFLNQAQSFGSSVLGGYTNIANGTYSVILGSAFGTARGIQGNTVAPASANPMNVGSAGVCQTALLILAVQTTDATATVLRSSTAAAGTTNQVILPNNSAYYFRGEVVSGVTGGGNTKGWTIEGVIKRGANAASTALVGTPTVTSSYADAGASTWTIAVTADTTNGGLAVTFTGQASTTIRTVAQIRTTEMTY